MQIGIDLGATKIEYVLLDNNNKELERDRSETPKDFAKTIIVIKDIIKKLQWKKKDINFLCKIIYSPHDDKIYHLLNKHHNDLVQFLE